MIKFENTIVYGFEEAIRGMRNPKNSWVNSDSCVCAISEYSPEHCINCPHVNLCNCETEDINSKLIIGPKDYNLMLTLATGGPVHAKYRRMIIVYVDITAPLYWWKEFDTYKIGTVCNSCSTMHKIADKEFSLEDFSYEHLQPTMLEILKHTIHGLNDARNAYISSTDKLMWWQMIQLLPSSYNQRRTIMMNYEVLSGIYPMRKNHKLDEWSVGFIEWIQTLPYSELITTKKEIHNV